MLSATQRALALRATPWTTPVPKRQATIIPQATRDALLAAFQAKVAAMPTFQEPAADLAPEWPMGQGCETPAQAIRRAYREAVEVSKGEIALRRECRPESHPYMYEPSITLARKAKQTRVYFSRG